MAIEEPSYQVIRASPPFELRQYQPMVIAEVTVNGDMSEAGRVGFRKIAGFIFGKNQSKPKDASATVIAMTAPVVMAKQNPPQKIAMTAPVTMSQDGQCRWKMYFVMPKHYRLADLPIPIDPDVHLTELPAKRMAVISFTGFNSERKTQAKAAELRSWLKSQGIESNAAEQLARYNPPWTLPFLRRNEVMIEY